MFFVQVVLMSETFIIGGFSRSHTRWKGDSDSPLILWHTNEFPSSRDGSIGCCSFRRTKPENAVIKPLGEASSLVMVKSYFTVMARCSKSNVTNENSNIPSNKHRNATRTLRHVFVFVMVSNLNLSSCVRGRRCRYLFRFFVMRENSPLSMADVSMYERFHFICCMHMHNRWYVALLLLFHKIYSLDILYKYQDPDFLPSLLFLSMKHLDYVLRHKRGNEEARRDFRLQKLVVVLLLTLFFRGQHKSCSE